MICNNSSSIRAEKTSPDISLWKNALSYWIR